MATRRLLAWLMSVASPDWLYDSQYSRGGLVGSRWANLESVPAGCAHVMPPPVIDSGTAR